LFIKTLLLARNRVLLVGLIKLCKKATLSLFLFFFIL
jgi:hypothetical protein